MTARPQDVALLPLPKWVPDPIIGHLLSKEDREFCEQYATDYARANVTAALASAQAREEELRAALDMIEGIATGSRTVNSLPHIQKIAAEALEKKQ